MDETPEVQVNGYAAQNESILKLARQRGCGRPIEEVVRGLAREKLAEAESILREIDEEWSPPPFDPLLVAQALGIRCALVKEPWLDDAMIFVQEGTPTILFRQQRSKARTHFNIFHEIAHTLFPDYQHNALYQHSRRPRLFEPEGPAGVPVRYCRSRVSDAPGLVLPGSGRQGIWGRMCGCAVQPLRRVHGSGVPAHGGVEPGELRPGLAGAPAPASATAAPGPGVAAGRDTPCREEYKGRVLSAVQALLRKQKLFIPPHLAVERRSCIHQAARSKKLVTG